MTEAAGIPPNPDGEGEHAAPEENQAVAKATAKSWLPLAVVAFVLAAGFGALYWWLGERQQAISLQLAQQADARAALAEEFTSRLGALTERNAEMAANEKAITARLDELTASLSKLYSERSGEDRTTTLADVEQLLFIASQRLKIERDPATAIAAMQSADQRLQESARPDWLELRQALIGDLTALQAVRMPDVEGHALYLADLVGRVGQLPLRSVEFAATGEPEQTPAGEGSVWWQLWHELVSIVDVERLDVPDTVLVDPAGRRLLYDGLRLELITARSSVLRRDTKNMAASLQIVERLLRLYFDLDDAAVVSILKTLADMQTLNLAPQLPDVNRSLEAVRELRSQRQ